MSVRAKLVVNSVFTNKDGKATINMNAVYSGSEENKKFWEATPAANLQLYTINPDAAAYFEQGKEYYVDFTEAERSKEDDKG